MLSKINWKQIWGFGLLTEIAKATIPINQQKVGFTQESIFGKNQPQKENSQLGKIKARAYLNCGINDTLPRLSSLVCHDQRRRIGHQFAKYQ